MTSLCSKGLIKSLLTEGRYSSHFKLIEFCAQRYSNLEPEDQVALIVYGRKYQEVKKILEKHLNFEENLKKSLLNNPLKEVEVPTVNLTNNKGEIAKVYLIENTPFTWSNLKILETPLKNKLEVLTGKKFAVLSEYDFEGYSYLLPVAVALEKRHLLNKFCFSGNLEADGRLSAVNHVEKKREACNGLGKTLITSDDFETFSDLLKFLDTSPKQIPILIATKEKTEENLKRDFELLLKGTRIETFPKTPFYQREFNHPPYWDSGKLTTPSDWKKVLEKFGNFLKKVDATFEDANIHITLDGPAALSFGFGIIHGVHKRAIFYQLQGGTYFPVITLDEKNSRLLKRYTPETPLIKVKDLVRQSNSKTLAVALDFVSHPLGERVKQFLTEKGINADLLILEHKQKGNITINRPWTDEVAQTFTLIRKYWEKKPYKQIYFFFGTPVAFAFGLGCAIGHFYKGKVFNYSPIKNTYEEVYKIEELEKVR